MVPAQPEVATLVAAVALLVVLGLIGATASAVVITGKNRELNRFNIDLVAANETAEKRRVEAENAQKRTEEEKRLASPPGGPRSSRTATSSRHSVR